jgi:hypothetical protein
MGSLQGFNGPLQDTRLATDPSTDSLNKYCEFRVAMIPDSAHRSVSMLPINARIVLTSDYYRNHHAWPGRGIDDQHELFADIETTS